MKIAHLSDLHLNTFFKNSNLKQIKYLLKYALDEGFDHLVITGDLTDNAAEEDFEILRKQFKLNGLLDSDRLSLVIGNHDIFGGIQTPEDIFNFPEKCRKINYHEKVKEFKQYFAEAFDKCVYTSKENIFPYAKILDDVLFTGINSIAEYSKIKNPFASNGGVDLNQFNELNDIFTNYGHLAKNKLVLIHHHFNKIKINKKVSSSGFWQNIEKQTMKLRKKKRLCNLFNNHQVDLILHGHLHETGNYERRKLRFVNNGGCIKNFGDNMNINFIELNEGQFNIISHTISSNEINKRNILVDSQIEQQTLNSNYHFSAETILT